MLLVSLSSLPYARARSWSVPSLPTRSFDWPRTRSPSRPTATTSTAVPTNAMRSLVWTFAGRRPTAADERVVAQARQPSLAGRGRTLRRWPTLGHGLRD